MPEKDLIKENNRMRKKLDPHNLKIYEDMSVYIRLNYKTKESKTEKILNGFLSKVLHAQRNGKNIESVTGEDYKEYADSISDGLQKRNIWKYAGMLAIILIGFNMIFDYLMDLIFVTIDGAPTTTTINLMQFLLHILTVAGIGVGFVFLLFYTIQYVLFNNWPSWKEYGLYFLVGAAAFLVYLITSSIIDLIDIGPSFETSMWTLILLGVIIIIAVMTLFFKKYKGENNA